jgi:hypothetical protein
MLPSTTTPTKEIFLIPKNKIEFQYIKIMAGQNLILKDMFLHVQNFKPPYQAIVNTDFLLTQCFFDIHMEVAFFGGNWM